jgi:hypothetical protein
MSTYPQSPEPERTKHPAPWIRDGVAAGVAAYLGSLLVYSIVDLALEHSLFFAGRTLGADLLGATLATDHPVLTILAYDGIRFLVVLLVALAMSAAIRVSWILPRVTQVTLIGGVAVLVLSEGVLLLVARPVSAIHFWWVVVAANLVAGVAMALVVVYRFLLRQLNEIARRMP